MQRLLGFGRIRIGPAPRRTRCELKPTSAWNTTHCCQRVDINCSGKIPPPINFSFNNSSWIWSVPVHYTMAVDFVSVALFSDQKHVLPVRVYDCAVSHLLHGTLLYIQQCFVCMLIMSGRVRARRFGVTMLWNVQGNFGVFLLLLLLLLLLLSLLLCLSIFFRRMKEGRYDTFTLLCTYIFFLLETRLDHTRGGFLFIYFEVVLFLSMSSLMYAPMLSPCCPNQALVSLGNKPHTISQVQKMWPVFAAVQKSQTKTMHTPVNARCNTE